MARTFEHGTVTELAEYATVPVINALTDWSHPCQAVAGMKKGEGICEGRLLPAGTGFRMRNYEVRVQTGRKYGIFAYFPIIFVAGGLICDIMTGQLGISFRLSEISSYEM